MSNLNVRNFPDEVLKELHVQADRAGMTLRGYVIQRLRGRVNFEAVDSVRTASVREQETEAPEEEFDYSETPFEDCPPEEKQKRKMAELPKKLPNTGFGFK